MDQLHKVKFNLSTKRFAWFWLWSNVSALQEYDVSNIYECGNTDEMTSILSNIWRHHFKYDGST